MKREPTYRTALVIVGALVFVMVCGCQAADRAAFFSSFGRGIVLAREKLDSAQVVLDKAREADAEIAAETTEPVEP